MENIKKHVDYLIVGQGIAGSILAYKLDEYSKSVLIIDETQGASSSKKASGLINPITGRRFVKSWQVDQLLNYANCFYQSLEQKFELSIIQEYKMHRILQSVEQQNDWAAKTKDLRYSHYLQNKSLIHYDHSEINNPLACIEIAPILKVNTPLLIEQFTEYFLKKDLLQIDKLDYKEIEVQNEFITYKNIVAKNIIFCEGYAAAQNPWFNYLPFLFSKGESLCFESKKLSQQYILGSNTNITPLGKNSFSVGASYAWNDLSLEVTKEKKLELIEKLDAIINFKYKIINQKAGIRPTVKDRRPLLGTHHKDQKLHIFNGMGTKGLSLAPFYAEHFIMHLEEQEKLDKDVDIMRFQHDFKN